MIPSGVFSYVKKMVTSEGVPNQGSYSSGPSRSDSRDGGTTLSKLKQHISSGFGTVSKLSSTRSSSNSSTESQAPSSSTIPGLVHQQSVVSSEDRSLLQKVWVRGERFDATDPKLLPPLISTPTAPSVGVLGSGGGGGAASPLTSPTGGKPGDEGNLPIPMRPGRDPGSSCRVCVKTLRESEFFKVCDECGNKVCEDCASYSSNQSNEGEENVWNCSICRRRKATRARLEKPPSIEGLGITPQIPPIMSSPLPPPSPGAHAALNLFAAMASTMNVQNKNSTSLTPNFAAAVSGDAALTTGQPLANGYANYRRRSVWAVSPQKSVEKPKILERSKSKDDSCKDLKATPLIPADVNKEQRSPAKPAAGAASAEGAKEGEAPSKPPAEGARQGRAPSKGPPPGEGGREGRPPSKHPPDGVREPRSSSKVPPGERPDGRRPRDKSRERTGAPRRAHDDDHLRPSSRMRHRRMSDYRIHEAGAGELLPSNTLHAARSEMDISRVRRKSCTNIQMTRPPDFGSGRMVNGTAGEDLGDKWRQKGRRKSMVRQQSYDDEEHKKDKEALTPWATGELPPRRHSMQGPTRREEALEAHKKAKQSLDFPYGRDHHPADQATAKDAHGKSAASGTPPRIGGDVDASNETPAERPTSSGRRSSYRASRDVDQEPDQTEVEDKTATADLSSQEAASGTAASGGKGTLRRSGSNSLDDERQNTRRRGSYDSSRRAQAIPASVRDSHQGPPQPGTAPQAAVGVVGRESGRKPRITQSLEVNTSCDLGTEGPQRQNSVSDAETIRIVIHDVDVERKKALEQGRRRVKIQRDMTDPGHRTRGLGMRVVGGKVGSDGRLFAYVVWTVRGGPAHNAGVVKGDKVLEWNGVQLTDRTFEEVCSIMEEVNTDMKTVDLLVESSNDLSLDSTDEPSALPQQTKKGSLECRSPSDPESDKLPTTSSIRRKLPQIPGDLIREPVSGKLQVQIWYDQEKLHLIATVVSAHDLRFRDAFTLCPPEAFVCLRLYPYNDCRLFSTGVAECSCKPMWNSSFIWEGLSGDLLLGLTLELTVYDYVENGDNGFLGETLIDLRHAYLDERPVWYRLQERRSRSANATPRGSIVSTHDFPMPIFRRPSSARSGSEEHGFDSRSSSLDSGLLHPEIHWNQSRSSSRRSSCFSEQDIDEVEYPLGRRYPHSMPQSRRSSMSYTSNHSLEIKAEDLEARLAISMSPIERRRSHSFRTAAGGEFLLAIEEQQRPRRASSHSILVRSGPGGRTPIDPRVWKDVYVMS